jgi:drug/metabolite transporter (DMT)-like permease
MPTSDPSRRHRGELYAALAAMGFGSAYVATSFALGMLGPVPAAVWRSALAGILLLLVLVGRQRGRAGDRDPRHGRAGDRDPRHGAATDVTAPGTRPAATVPAVPARAVRLLVLAIFGGPVFLTGMNLAVANAGATIAAFVAGLYAVLAAVIAPALLPERLTGRIMGGFVLALVGTALLAELDPTGTSVTGMAWGLVAATSFALYLVLSRRWSAPYHLDGTVIGLANAVLTVVAIGILLLAADPGSLVPSPITPDAVIALAWLAAVAAFGPVLTVASVRLIPAARTAGFLLLNPVTATVLGVILLGERPSPPQIAGGALVLLGMAVVTVRRGSRPPRGESKRPRG